MSNPNFQHGSVHDTLRWGDTETIAAIDTINSEALVGNNFKTVQLVNAHWRWPLVWWIQVLATPNMSASAARDLDLAILITIGVGQAQMQFIKHYIITTASGYAPVVDGFNLPAADIQIQARVSVVGNVQTGGTNDSMQIGVFAAPLTEPHAMTHMLDELARGGQPQEVHWMPPGFVEQPLHYRR